MTLTNEQIELVAEAVHESLRAYKKLIEQEQGPTWLYLNEEDKTILIKIVTRLVDGKPVGTKEIHDWWVEYKEELGWQHGPVKNYFKKTHPCLVNYWSLPYKERLKDIIIRQMVTLYASVYGVVIDHPIFSK